MKTHAMRSIASASFNLRRQAGVKRLKKTKPISKDPVMDLNFYITTTYKNKKASASHKQKTLFEKTNAISEKVKCS